MILALALVAALSVIAFQTWVIYVLGRQHGRSLLAQDQLAARLAAAESAIQHLRTPQPGQPPAPTAGLRPSEQAPSFTLLDLQGRPRSLSDLLGSPTVMIFFDPECGYCQQLAPRLGQLPPGAPKMIVMSRGDRDAQRRLAREHRWGAEVLLEPGWEIATAYRTNATPTAYLIDAEGRIASGLATGVDGVLELIRTGTEEKMRSTGLSIRPLRESRLQRDGLPAGTPAPDFTLPDLGGAEHSLAKLRGRRVLLVFSDPACGPCQTLGPPLEALHRRHAGNGLQVLMVSRGELSANREKANEHGLTFPVLLQRSWEISRLYAKFATPIGYLIDERGVIASDVAIGAEAILQLGERHVARATVSVSAARREG